MHANRTATALLVDDDPATLRANQERLEHEGYCVFLAPHEKEALSCVRESAPDVVVLMADHHSVNVGQRRLGAVRREGW